MLEPQGVVYLDDSADRGKLFGCHPVLLLLTPAAQEGYRVIGGDGGAELIERVAAVLSRPALPLRFGADEESPQRGYRGISGSPRRGAGIICPCLDVLSVAGLPLCIR